MSGASDGPRIAMAAGLSGHPHSIQAAELAAQQCAEAIGPGTHVDLLFVFFSAHHAPQARAIVHAAERRLNPSCIVGVSAEAVLGAEVELENAPGISMMAMSLPTIGIYPFHSDDLPHVRQSVASDYIAFGKATGMSLTHRGTILLCDPFSVPMTKLLPDMNHAGQASTGAGRRIGPIAGGLASAATPPNRPGGNILILNDRIFSTGGVGVSFSGDIQIDTLVSQGCRPIGSPLVVTGAKGQMITSLGNRPAVEALSDVLDGLDGRSREQLRRGLFLGRAISEYKDRFGRNDFLIRDVLGVDRNSGAIAVRDLMRVGTTVQFHLRDQATAAEDLAMLLDAQKLHDAPYGGLLFTCNGRGTRMFDRPHHDASAISRAFAGHVPAEQQAKVGSAIAPAGFAPPGRRLMPLAGFFAAGEIGPIGDQVFVHGQTASLAIFRPLRRPAAAPLGAPR